MFTNIPKIILKNPYTITFDYIDKELPESISGLKVDATREGDGEVSYICNTNGASCLVRFKNKNPVYKEETSYHKNGTIAYRKVSERKFDKDGECISETTSLLFGSFTGDTWPVSKTIMKSDGINRVETDRWFVRPGATSQIRVKRFKDDALIDTMCKTLELTDDGDLEVITKKTTALHKTLFVIELFSPNGVQTKKNIEVYDFDKTLLETHDYIFSKEGVPIKKTCTLYDGNRKVILIRDVYFKPDGSVLITHLQEFDEKEELIFTYSDGCVDKSSFEF